MVSAAQSNLIDAQLAPAQLNSEISYSLAAKALQAQQQEGATALKLLDSANLEIPTPQPGDPLIAKATGLGTFLDTLA